jgi:SpoVK/Ycf46/Vps4 family AAA+-type ATPase
MKKLSTASGNQSFVGVVDEVDEIISGVTNDKRAAAVTKAEWNSALDHVHAVDCGPIIIMTSNNTIDELRKKAGEHADAMLRPGRIDIILHVDAGGRLTEVRSYA